MGILRIAPLHKMSRRCTTVKDVPADAFIKKCADFLKRQPKFQVPKWADLVKTGHFKELAPYDEDWFYVRAASIARKIYLRPGCGIGALRHWYGGAHRRGTRTTRHATASGAVIRNALKGLEAQGLVEVPRRRQAAHKEGPLRARSYCRLHPCCLCRGSVLSVD